MSRDLVPEPFGDARQIPGHPRYAATRSGHIIGPRGAMRGYPDAKGYLRVALRTSGKPVNHSVHSLVALAWHGPRPVGFHVAHDDGNQTNNAAANLAYKSPAANEADKTRHGRPQIGSRSPFAKLNEDAARDIYARYHSGGVKRRELAAEYDVSIGTIDAVIYGWLWAHATGAKNRATPKLKIARDVGLGAAHAQKEIT